MKDRLEQSDGSTLFGWYKFSSSTKLLDLENKIACSGYNRLYADAGDFCAVYSKGVDDLATSLLDNSYFHVLLGRTYTCELAPGTAEPSNLAIFDPSRFDGSFRYLRVSRGDGGRPELSIFADRFGSRMWLYIELGGVLYFAINMLGIKILLGSQFPDLCSASLFHYYHFLQAPNDSTLFQGLRKIPPANVLECTGSCVSQRTYFSLSELYKPGIYIDLSERELAERIDGLLDESLKVRFGQAKKIGLTLSGGVDSSFVAKKLIDQGVSFTGYHMVYRDSYDELDRLEQFASDTGIRFEVVELLPEDVTRIYELASGEVSEPASFNNASLLAVYGVAEKAGIDTMFEGGGADHMFLGMNRDLLYYRVWTAFRHISRMKLRTPVDKLLSVLPYSKFGKLLVLFRNWSNDIPPYLKRRMVENDSYDPQLERAIYESGIKKFYEQFQSDFGGGDFRLFFALQTLSMDPEDHFYPPAELQFGFGMDPVSPFWSSDIVSLALSMPMDWKTKSGQTKFILRKAASLGYESEYWYKRKIGLADSRSFLAESVAGREWLNTRVEEARASSAFEILSETMPGKSVLADRLVPLVVWMEANKC